MSENCFVGRNVYLEKRKEIDLTCHKIFPKLKLLQFYSLYFILLPPTVDQNKNNLTIACAKHNPTYTNKKC